MPVYKQKPSYLRAAIRSILAQNYRNYKFIIVVDGAPADTVKMIREEMQGDHRTRVIVKMRNEGVAKALNTGFQYFLEDPEIQYLTWVSSDNIYYPTFIEKLRDVLKYGSENIGLVYSSFRHIGSGGQSLQTEKDLIAFREFQKQPKENLLDVCFVGVSFMYKKQYAANIKGYELEPVEDYDYWLRLTEFCDIDYVPEELMDYRKNSPLSISAQLNRTQMQYRRWRYAFNLAKQQARNRRGIPFETTIVFPVSHASDETVKKLDTVLDISAYPPFYSNFKLLIYDISPTACVIPALKTIPDPRITFLARPGANERQAIKFGVEAANTPYTILFGKGNFPTSPYVFYSLVLQQRQVSNREMLSQPLIAASADQHAAKLRILLAATEPVYGELYRTDQLSAIIKGLGL
ncbi:glycosyltransferase [Fodinisporobacter ferrooxydans]|uniref:Glycosyltransferase n=1 Tax=Fodinisporobacter ferrooxydans TaxID=2901836 RepID=A0ABY4CJU0_9BACL|nr:glycosyltransferase [Alicyclobacillaceae bacterium MYW30-H2]